MPEPGPSARERPLLTSVVLALARPWRRVFAGPASPDAPAPVAVEDPPPAAGAAGEGMSVGEDARPVGGPPALEGICGWEPKAADALRTLMRAVDQSPASIVITDAAGTIEYVNPRFTQVSGYSAAEAVGQNPRILKTERTPPGEFQRLWQTISSGREWRGEFANRKRGGELYWEAASISPITDDQGRITHFIAIKEDITARKEAERAARESEARFRHLVEGLQAVFWEAHLHPLAFTFLSERVEAILGYRVQRWLDDPDFWFDHVHPDDRERTRRQFAAAVEAGRDQELEYRMVRADGGQVWLRDIVRVVADASGRAVKLLGLKVDITHLKEAQAAAVDSEAQLAAIVDAARDAIVGVDDAGRVVVFNAAAEAMLGVSTREAIGGPLERFLPAWPQGDDEGSSAPSRFGRSPRRLSARRADGSDVPVEASVSAARAGGSRLVTMILRDVTERQRAEEEQSRLRAAIENAAREWRRTFDALDSAVLILDREGRILRLNRAALAATGGDWRDRVGRPLAELGDEEPWATAGRMVREAPGGPAPVRRVRDAGRCWEVSATWMENEDGRPQCIVLVRDTTAVAALEDSVRQAATMAAVGALTAGVAHEVRNPLFAISANVDALRTVLAGAGNVAELIEAVTVEVKRLNAVMVDLLEFGKPPALVLRECPLQGAVDLAVQFTTAAARAGEVEVVVRPGPWTVSMDQDRMAQVIENLVENAIQHSPRGGTVTVEMQVLEDHGRWIRTTVADDGPGFGAEDLPRVFDPFFTRRRGGTGLGLSIAQRIVQQHGGRIHAANREGRGAALSVELPAAEAVSTAAVAAPEGASA